MSAWHKNVGSLPEPEFHSAELAVFVSRFQPLSTEHLSLINEVLLVSDTLLICVGSANEPRSPDHPFSFEERKKMILKSVSRNLHKRILIFPVDDYPNDDPQWVTNVRGCVNRACEHFDLGDFPNVMLVDHSKHLANYYTTLFPQFAAMNIPDLQRISVTKIREAFFNDSDDFEKYCADGSLPECVVNFMRDFKKTVEYKQIKGG